MNKCRAIASIGDDLGDNSCTFRCQLESGHSGQHSETFKVDTKNLTMTWDGSEKILIDRFKFKVTRYIDYQYYPESKKQSIETIVTENMTEDELFDKYCCAVTADPDGIWSGWWYIESYEFIEGTKVSEWVYEDSLKDN